jgi:hypothetical protein
VIYVVKDLVRMVAYRDTLEHIQVIHLINVIYVVKDLVSMVAFRHTLEYRYIQVIHLINVAYVDIRMYITFIRFITSMYSNVCL